MSEQEKKPKEVVASFESVFLNSKSIFVEYVDLIKAPYIAILKSLAYGPEIREYPKFTLDLSEIHNKGEKELDNWYIQRPYRNLLYNFVVDKDSVNIYDLELALDKNLEMVPEILKLASLLNVGNVLRTVFAKDNLLVKKGIIWYPYENPVVLEDIRTTFSDIYRFLEVKTGPIDEVLKEVPEDSTYIFSDIAKVGLLEDLNKLDYSSIIMPVEYGYNARDGKYLVDIPTLKEKHIFKFDTFYATEVAI